MNESKEILSPEEKPATEAELSRSLQKFQKALKGWFTSQDGEDFCPDHWEAYLNKFDAQEREGIKDYSCPTSEVAKYRKMRDGWGTICEYEDKEGKACGRSVSIPYRE